MLLDKTKHTDVKYVSGVKTAGKYVNNKRFRRLTELDDETFELSMAKSKITLDMPIQIGFFILCYAKLRMLSFYYDCLLKFIPREKFELFQMDTDSLYFAVSENTLEECVPPHLIEQFKDEFSQWFPRTCCERHRNYDKRTPGLFKRECEGHTGVALCSKSYCIETETNHCKFSSKGVNKGQFNNPMELYKNVLRTGTSKSATNKGFRVHNDRIFTYCQQKQAFVYFYIKRKVLADGIHTRSLDI